jgi:WD40 repeat protein
MDTTEAPQIITHA